MDILFRSSGSGALMTEKQGGGITQNQLDRITELEKERDTGLNINGNKVKFEGTKKPQELEELIAKRDAPPELSDTAKAFVKNIWLQREKGIVEDIKSKYLDKGVFNEEDSIILISEVDNIFYSKNEERRSNKDHTGECDVFKDLGHKKVVHDVKTSWNATTFMNSKPSIDNEWQGRIYMELWDADEFHLRFCLVDCPPHLVEKEKDIAKWKYYSGDMSDAELDIFEKSMEPIYSQIEKNLIYSNNPAFSKEERVKTFVFYRDPLKMEKMAERVKMAREYYKTISLNGKN